MRASNMFGRIVLPLFALASATLAACSGAGGSGGDGSGDGGAGDVSAGDAGDGGVTSDAADGSGVGDATDVTGDVDPHDASDADTTDVEPADADATEDADVFDVDDDADVADGTDAGVVCGRGLILDESGTTCVLDERPAGADFAAEGVWAAEGSSYVELGAVEGTEYGGAAVFPGSAACAAPGLVRAEFPFADVPWIAGGYRLIALVGCTESTVPPCVDPALWIDGLLNSTTALGIYGSADERSTCVPPAVRGRDLSVVLAQRARAACIPSATLVDAVHIEDGSTLICHSVAGVRNGDFEAPSVLPWSVLTDNVSVEETLGNRVLAFRPAGCDDAQAEQWIVRPGAEVSPALRADISVSAGLRLRLGLGDREFEYSAGDTEVSVCLDPGLPIISSRVELVVAPEVCGASAEGPVYVDNVRIENDPACAPSQGVLGGSFDDLGWTSWTADVFSDPGGFAAVTRVEQEPGDSAMRLAVGSDCSYTSFLTHIGGPSALPGEKLRFRYRVLGSGANAAMVLNDVTYPLVAVPTWQTYELCLRAWGPYATQTLFFEAQNQTACESGPVSILGAPFSLQINDVEIVTDGACL